MADDCQQFDQERGIVLLVAGTLAAITTLAIIHEYTCWKRNGLIRDIFSPVALQGGRMIEAGPARSAEYEALAGSAR